MKCNLQKQDHTKGCYRLGVHYLHQALWIALPQDNHRPDDRTDTPDMPETTPELQLLHEANALIFLLTWRTKALAPINTVNRIPTINETTKCRLWVGFDQRLSAARPYPTIREGRSQCRSPPGPHASEMRGSRLLTDASSSNFLMWPRNSVPALAAKSIWRI